MALKQDKPAEAKAEAPAKPKRAIPEPMDLLDIASGVRIRQITPFGNMHVQITVDLKSEQELEVFAQLGKGGDLATSDLEAICRMISLWLRAGGKVQHVINQLKGIGSSLQVSTKEGKIRSLGDGLARALEKYMRAKRKFGLTNLVTGQFDPAELESDWTDFNQGRRTNGNGHKPNGGAAKVAVSAVESTIREEQFKVRCPDCQSPLYFAEGCVKCEACGYSHC